MFKRCSRCGAEYQLTVSQCADCGSALEHTIDADPLQPARAPSALPPSSELARVRVADPWWLEDLAEALQREGITSRIDSDPPGRPLSAPAAVSRYGRAGYASRVGLYVRPGDLEAALRIDHALFAQRTPDAGPLADPADPSVCPACGVALASDAGECASCGLAFPDS